MLEVWPSNLPYQEIPNLWSRRLSVCARNGQTLDTIVIWETSCMMSAGLHRPGHIRASPQSRFRDTDADQRIQFTAAGLVVTFWVPAQQSRPAGDCAIMSLQTLTPDKVNEVFQPHYPSEWGKSQLPANTHRSQLSSSVLFIHVQSMQASEMSNDAVPHVFCN